VFPLIKQNAWCLENQPEDIKLLMEVADFWEGLFLHIQCRMKLCGRKYHTLCEGESWVGVMNEPDEANTMTRLVLCRRA